MFTLNKIQVSTIPLPQGSLLLRDGEICYVGKVFTRVPRRLVPVNSLSLLNTALDLEDVAGLIVTPELQDAPTEEKALILSDNPLKTAYAVHEYLCSLECFHWQDFPSFISPSARIDPSALVSERNVRIGANVQIGPHAYIAERSFIEDNVVIGPGVKIGVDAFEAAKGADRLRATISAGGVLIREGASIGSNSVIERATFGGFTLVEKHAFISSLAYLAHDTRIGPSTTIAAKVSIAGRTEIGEGCYIGLGSTIRNGLRVHNRAHVSMGSVVTQDVPEDTTVTGNFAVSHELWVQFIKSLGAK